MDAPLGLTRKFGPHYQMTLSWRWESSKLLLEELVQKVKTAQQWRMEKVPALSQTSMIFSHLQLRQLRNPVTVHHHFRGRVGRALTPLAPHLNSCQDQ